MLLGRTSGSHDLDEEPAGTYCCRKNIDVGIYLARKYRQSVRMVTPEGELLNPGGSMTGGAFKNSSSLLSRRREIRGVLKRRCRC
ncbi:MAG: hypothetical protein ACLUUO_14475 [Sellimonas intestinalis]